MIHSGHFDKGLGAMVRDPKNADKTATEILKAYEGTIHDKLSDDRWYDGLKYPAAFIAIWLLGALGLLVCPR